MTATLLLSFTYGYGQARGGDSTLWDALRTVKGIPAPFQHGDTPTEMWAEHHGVRERLLQYGEQPRP